jgi:rhamnulose-1-phosphate aldolase/alcohol dehydrogenase
MATELARFFTTPVDRWPAGPMSDDELDQLVLRSQLLGGDRRIANYGGGNTSAKTHALDHTGEERSVLWVKASGSDLATIDRHGFAGLRLDEIEPLSERDEMDDAEMVDYLGRCQLAPSMPRPSIETLLHAFVPAVHVDHTHPDAVNAIACAANGHELARQCWGDRVAWVDYVRPGFALAKEVGRRVREGPDLLCVVLAKHGLVTWGDTAADSYRRTLDAIGSATAFVNSRAAGRARYGGSTLAPLPEVERRALLSALAPVVRGALSDQRPKVACVEDGPAVLELVHAAAAPKLTSVGAACPDHLVHTKRRPLWISFDPAVDDLVTVSDRVREEAARFRNSEREHIERHGGELAIADLDARVVVIERLGLIAAGPNEPAARLSRDLYARALEVMAGATALDRFVSLDDAESFAVEQWPLELYKLSLAPPASELEGRVALVTGAAGGIGRAIVARLGQLGACVIGLDVDEAGAQASVEHLGTRGLGVTCDVTDEDAIAAAVAASARRFGGVDIVVANAGSASSAPIESTTVEDWERLYAIFARGSFLLARAAFKLMNAQGRGGSLVFVASKNALVAGRDAAAYSSAKAAQVHLARCLAEEGGASGIRVNTVNPDAVLHGSKIWTSEWREARAESYGIAPDGLEDHYRKRTTLGVSVMPEDVAEAVVHFASTARSGKTTGNVLAVDAGVPAAYPR